MKSANTLYMSNQNAAALVVAVAWGWMTETRARHYYVCAVAALVASLWFIACFSRVHIRATYMFAF